MSVDMSGSIAHRGHAVVVVVGRMEAEPVVEAEGREVVELDLEVEVAGPLAGRPAGAGREHGGGDAAAAVVGAGGHAEHSGPASFDHQHPHAEHLVVVGRGEETGPRGDPGKDQLAGRFGVRAILHLCPGGEPSRAGGEADRHGQGRGRWSNGEQAVDRSGRHHRRSLTVVAARGELVIEPAMQLRRTDLDERCLVAAGVEPLGDLECLCPPSGSASATWTVAAGQAFAASRSISSTGSATTLPPGAVRAWPRGRCTCGGIARR
jgi:hypothetical protein